MQVDFNTFFIIFGAIQIALSQLPKPAHTTMYAAIGLLTVGYSAILVILICKLIHGRMLDATSDLYKHTIRQHPRL